MAEIKNLKKAASRILKAVKNKEKIIVYGDSDLDGVGSVIILKECLRNLGGDAILYFLDREKDGYGINKNAIEELKKHAPALFVVLDCGIGNFEEVKILKKLKFEVIIIDHHEILDKIPQADIVVDPKQEGDKYPFKYFAAAGLAFRLAKLLLKDKMTDSLRKDLVEIAAMATIADMMPRTDDNEEIIIEGLSSLMDSWRPGIQALLASGSFHSLSLTHKVTKMISLLNVRDFEGGMPAAFRLLTMSDIGEAGKMVERLLKKKVEKRRKIKEVVEEVERKTLANKDNIILEGNSSWELILLGIASAILVQKYNRPVFLYRKDKNDSQGSIRAPEGHNVVEAMKACSVDLMTYGGHPMAAGFRVKNKNIEKFRECLIAYYDNKNI